MAPPLDGTGNPFWDYSLALYGQAPVALACLGLQDRLGLDVNLLLFCCWQGARGVRMSEADLRALNGAVADWRDTVVLPLRVLRRAMKGLETAGAEALRAQVKSAELEAERLEQQQLLALAGDAGHGPDADGAVGNLRAYLTAVGTAPTELDRDDLATLLVAAFSDLSVARVSELLRAAQRSFRPSQAARSEAGARPGPVPCAP